MKCNQPRTGFELVSLCPFPTVITITPRQPLGNPSGVIHISYINDFTCVCQIWQYEYICMGSYIWQCIIHFVKWEIFCVRDFDCPWWWRESHRQPRSLYLAKIPAFSQHREFARSFRKPISHESIQYSCLFFSPKNNKLPLTDKLSMQSILLLQQFVRPVPIFESYLPPRRPVLFHSPLLPCQTL